MRRLGTVKLKKNKVLPLKAELFDGDALSVTDADIAPPVIQVTYQSASGPAQDVSDHAYPMGQGTEGNQFEFCGGKGQYNLKTSN